MVVFEKIKRIWTTHDLRKNIIFVLGVLVIYRIIAHIPLPGVDVMAMRDYFGNNQLLGFIDMFSGGGIRNFSVAAMGVAPYITASIILQLLTMIVPSLEELSKEGESGQNKINMYTRLLTIPISVLQAVGLLSILGRSSQGLLAGISRFEYILAVVSLTAGTVLLMWLGELITEKNIGNGVSILIFTGIISRLLPTLRNTFISFDSSNVLNLVLFAAIGLITIISVIFITEGQRNLPVSYAKMTRGNRMSGGVNTHLPLKVNQAGVIPIIFAISIVMFPPVIAQLFVGAKTAWIAGLAEFVIYFFNNRFWYGTLYFVCVVGFTYFYTAIIFQPDKVAENLQKQGGFLPGIRPGRPTSQYLNYVSNRIMLAGALFLGAIAVLPMVVQRATGVSALSLGGTSLLIVVSVVLEIVRQIESQMTMRDYEEI